MVKSTESAQELPLVWTETNVRLFRYSATESDQTSGLGGLVLVLYTSICITEEPSAVIPLARICVGTAQVTGRSTTTQKMSGQGVLTTQLDNPLDFLINFLSNVYISSKCCVFDKCSASAKSSPNAYQLSAFAILLGLAI